MNPSWTDEIWKMRKSIKTVPGTPKVSLEQIADSDVSQLLFLSQGCKNACTFCNYGFDYKLSVQNVMPELVKINFEKNYIRNLELEANGSFLSEREIDNELLKQILKFISTKKFPIITIETHYKDVTEEKLKLIRSIFGKKQIVEFEFGFESSNPETRKSYNKEIDNSEFIKVCKLCKKYNVTVSVNVLLGAPFMSRKEQIKDCLETLDFIMEYLPKDSYAVLFPLSIKENTLIRNWQKEGKYNQISSWEFVELLYRIPEKYLDRFTIAWWGERENTFTKGIMQFPKTCDKCQKRLMSFYRSIYFDWNPEKRRKWIEEIWKTRCDCDK